ncbi:MAG: SDR family oxidoreductase, partial [Gammaproteobacteria bacterium]|nr:SDR family oxidoreductase [Gammaproteobacteria bacterium]
ADLGPRLIEAGWQVRAAARHRAVLEARDWGNVELVAADALDPETLAAAVQDIDVAFYLVHSMAAGRNFAELDAEAAKNFAAAATEAGVGRIVYLGGLIPADPRSRHLKSRAETGDVLRHGAVPVTEIRAGMIVGPGSAAYEVIRDLVNYLPVMITPRWVQSRSTPIALDNLLDYLVSVSRLPDALGKIYDVGGPEVLTYEQLMRQYGEIVGKRFWLLSLPVLTPRLSSYWLKLVTAVPTNIARALIDGLEHDVIADNKAINELIPLKLKTFKESVAAALEAEQNDTLSAHWAEGSIVCRNFHPEYAYYAKRAGGMASTWASKEALWRQVMAFGGDEGYYYAESLWFLRRLINWFAGGPSFYRRRRHPRELRVGDVVDAWRVIAAEPNKRLTLLMEMRGPGSGVFEFDIRDRGDHRILRATAYWHPAGPAGLIYWYALLPVHAFLFRGMTAAIAKRAEKKEGEPVDAPT